MLLFSLSLGSKTQFGFESRNVKPIFQESISVTCRPAGAARWTPATFKKKVDKNFVFTKPECREVKAKVIHPTNT